MVTISNLPRETELEIQRLIDSGKFEDSTSVVVQAIHSLTRETNVAERERRLVLEGLAERGQLIDDSPEFGQTLREEAHALTQSGRPLSDLD